MALSDFSTRDTEAGADICLIVPPFDSIDYPPLGIAVLANACSGRGLRVRQLHGSLMLAARLGYEGYAAIGEAPLAAVLGERLFLPYAYSAEEQAKLGPLTSLTPSQQAAFDRAAPEIPALLAEITERVLALQPRIVGLSTNFQQNLATIALARAIKLAAPEIRLVLGGANVALPMGAALQQLFPWIDHFFAGEADFAFPDFCERVLAGSADEPQLIKCKPVVDMRTVGAPDFTDYFETLRAYQDEGRLPSHLPRLVPLESSRGCWWGAKHHCTFCGLNGEMMDFRHKTAEAVLGEIDDVVGQWGAARIHFSDNIMPLSYLDSVFPRLEDDPPAQIFYEVKANLREDQIAAMARGGVYSIQPGIESLATHTLQLMRKGVTGLQNIALLRACRTWDISIVWNLLYGFPGERAEDYRATLALLPRLEHLVPTNKTMPISIDRYSPYHGDPQAFGIASIAPYDNYYGLYPEDAPVEDIAYHFKGHYTTELTEDPELLQALHDAIDAWHEAWRRDPPVLRLIDRGGSQVAVVDTRRIARAPLATLSRAAERALAWFERPHSRDALPAEIEAEVDALLARDFLIAHEGKLLSVVTRDPRAADQAATGVMSNATLIRSPSTPVGSVSCGT